MAKIVSKKVVVLLVVGTMDRGGVEMMLMNILRYIDKSRFELIFLCFEDKKYDFEDEILALGSKIIITPDVKEVGVSQHIQNLRDIISSEKIAIVHAHTYFNSMFSILAAKLEGVKVRITHSHNTKSEESMSIAKKVYSVVAKATINMLSTAYFACGVDAGRAMYYVMNKFTVINNGIPLEEFRYDKSARKKLRSHFKIAADETVLMNVGRFELQKNHTFLIDIYAEYLKLNPNSKLALLGDGSLREEIESKVETLGIQSKVIFMGKRSDVNKLYSLADVLLLPSLHEGLPVTMVEAQANGLRCVVSSEVDKEAGFTECVKFFPLSDSAKEWAMFIYNNPTDRIDTKSMKGGKYDIEKQVSVIESLYLRLTGQGGA